ncbi:hypothetical protein SAMN04244573_03050 [Azotobacter beijerinckii]|uniref:Uncharacterized protein n=1 Tax=Azotobacter beijerinckii TaxID=170623 RepID=A0A1H9M6G5_9GAMM|nr:hypothetical protein [Azotobacter beijerinckii]SER18713.1 hypothetical protein SAMN04244573_03050 [Azotobacter beijerinckii]
MERIDHKKIFLLGRMSFLILVGGAGWVAGSAQAGDEMPVTSEEVGKSNDNERRSQPTQPPEELSTLVEEYRAHDPNASFSFFNGHIDSFSTTPKNTIPEYAVKVLKALKLPTQTAEPLKIREPIFSGTVEKQSHDVEAKPDEQLPYVGEESQEPEKSKGKAKEDSRESSTDEVTEENRTEATSSPHEMLKWERPTKELLAKEKQAASKILQAFLEQYGNLFEISAEELNESMKLMDFTHGAYTRRAIYKQFYSKNEAILYGKTIVQFDVNWNVVGISRMIVTPQKFPLDKLKAGIPSDKAIKIASNAMEGCTSDDAKPLVVEPSIDLIRKRRVWNVELTSRRGACHWRVIVDRAEGTVLNVSDLVSQAYNDAKVNRWYFSGGDLFSPQQIVSTNQYTRNDRRLEHDFFYMMNDHRCEGSAEADCPLTPQVGDTWCANAYGTDNGSSYIRATRRLDRDFVSYFPGGESETFGETNAYYWGRWFSQWLKPSLDALGVLPSSASDYPRVLIISNACTEENRSWYNAAFAVTTDDDKGEGGGVIRLAHKDPAGSSDSNAGCQGGGCFVNPSELHHELNHFYLRRYHAVDSDLDCGGSNELQLTHEGILGTAVPHAFWHDYYNVGYAPTDTNKLYFSNSSVGRVHTNDTDLSKLTDFSCANAASTKAPYSAGRVVGQALWKFYHGKKVDGATITNTWYPSTDTDFNTLVYWAAELQSGSTLKDRYEFANRIMEILDKYSNWSSSGKSDYCAIFATHELEDRINPEYCN